MCLSYQDNYVILYYPARSSVAIATLAYNENATDSAKTKAGGAFLNAIIFVAIIAGLTFILVFLYWLGCSRFIKGYFFFSMFSIFFILTGLLGVKLLQVRAGRAGYATSVESLVMSCLSAPLLWRFLHSLHCVFSWNSDTYRNRPYAC